MTYPRPSPPPSSLPAGGLPLQPCSGLGGPAGERFGCSGDQVRVPFSMVFSQGTPLHFSPGLPATCEFSCFGGPGSGGLLTPFQRGHRGSGLYFVPGVLRENFRGSQGFGWLATGAGSLPSQCLPQECPFPDGDSSLPPGCHAPWRLGHFHRSQGCVFPSSHPPTRSEVASVCVEGQGLSVPCPPLWPCSSPVDFHKGHQRTVPSCQGQGYPSEGLPRRLAGTSVLQGVMLQPLSAGPAPVPQLGFLSQRGEIRPQALTAVRVSGHDLRHSAMASVSGPPSHTAPAVPPVFLASQGLGNSTGVSITSGSDGIICAPGASGSPAQAQVSAPLQGTLVSGPPPLGSPHLTGRVVSGLHQPVEQDRMALRGFLSRFLPLRSTCTRTPQWWAGEHMWAPSQPEATGRNTWCPVTSTFWNWRLSSRHSNSFTTLWQAGQSSSTRTTRPWHVT